MKVEVERLCDRVIAVYQKPEDEEAQCVILDEEAVAQILHLLYPELGDLTGKSLRLRAQAYGRPRLVA
ncbi:hypothetical protein [Novosphingobium panipatense]|uniref:Uncharacterized protein n=1 Tax=Novosphingobium panipatense TaxID=428991 RepID=A0ABY1Q4H4_9SPHN|nr:hypothetical protein [Novosphingobium panipatense]SMP58472.1 hypothetical protein SAMN06296065_102478 [Novosphingobium panipatense]